MKTQTILSLLQEIFVKPIVPFDLNLKEVVVFDFTKENADLQKIDLSDTDQFSEYIFDSLKKNNSPVGLGRYAEDRTIYARSTLFDTEKEARTIHLGIDIWAQAGTPIFAPLDGTVHSIKNNASFGDYGPTIILTHTFGDLSFHTLFGHLSTDSLSLKQGDKILAGQEIARIGTCLENGNWPEHVHFQIIIDMLGKEGDFPGVCKPSEKEMFFRNCPDPNLLLRSLRI